MWAMHTPYGWSHACWVVSRQKNSITLVVSSSVALVSPDSCLSILVSSDATSLMHQVDMKSVLVIFLMALATMKATPLHPTPCNSYLTPSTHPPTPYGLNPGY